MARWQYPQFFNPIAGEVSVTGGSPGNAVVITSDDGPIPNPILLQYQSLVGPVLKVTPAAAYDPSTATFASSYPDFAKKTKTPHTYHQFPSFVPTSDQTLDWWKGVFPSAINRITYRTANQPALTWTPQHNPAEGSKLDWLGYKPDWLARRLPQQPAALYWSTFTPPTRTIEWWPKTEVPVRAKYIQQPTNASLVPQHNLSEGSAMDWVSRYPDKIWRKLPAIQVTFWWNTDTPAVVAPFDPSTALIKAEFPPFIWSKKPNYQFSNPFRFEYPVAALVGLDWAPVLISIDAAKDSMIPSGMDPGKA